MHGKPNGKVFIRIFSIEQCLGCDATFSMQTFAVCALSTTVIILCYWIWREKSTAHTLPCKHHLRTQTQTFKHLMQLPYTHGIYSCLDCQHTFSPFAVLPLMMISFDAKSFKRLMNMSTKPHECDDFWIVPSRIDDATWCQRRKSNSLNEARNHAWSHTYYMCAISANFKLCAGVCA